VQMQKILSRLLQEAQLPITPVVIEQ